MKQNDFQTNLAQVIALKQQIYEPEWLLINDKRGVYIVVSVSPNPFGTNCVLKLFWTWSGQNGELGLLTVAKMRYPAMHGWDGGVNKLQISPNWDWEYLNSIYQGIHQIDLNGTRVKL